MVVAQLPSGAAGTAAGVLVWSITCLAFNTVLLWLLWTGNEKKSYISLLSMVTFLATTTSIIEQIHVIIYWDDVMTARLAWIQANTENPVLAASDGCIGLALVTWTIRWGCYVAEAGLAFFWAFSLTQAVYCWRDDIRVYRPMKLINEAGKPLSIFIATLTMSVLQAKSLQDSCLWWNLVLNLFYCIFCAGGLLMFLLIGLEYIQTRRLFRRMNSQQRKEFLYEPIFIPRPHNRMHSNATSIMTTARRPTDDSSEHFGALQQRKGGIYDKYLIARTFIPFMALCLFEIDNILINKSRPDKMRDLAKTSTPDLTASTASSYLVGFIPGCLASFVLPVAFGTTKQFRDKLYQTVVPVRLQSADFRRRRRRLSQECTFFVDMDSDAGILSRNRRLSMEKRLRIEVTYEFEVRNEVVTVDSEVLLGAEKGSGQARRDNDSGGDGTMGEEKSVAARAQQVEKKQGRIALPPRLRTVERSLPPLPASEALSMHPFVVDSRQWDDTARILPKKPSVSFMRGQL